MLIAQCGLRGANVQLTFTINAKGYVTAAESRGSELEESTTAKDRARVAAAFRCAAAKTRSQRFAVARSRSLVAATFAPSVQTQAPQPKGTPALGRPRQF